MAEGLGPTLGALLVLGGAWAATGLGPSVASAQTRQETETAAAADALINAGFTALQANEPERALGLFRQAYRLDPSPRALAQIGLAEGALGRWIEAEEHLSRALAANNDAWIQARREALTVRLGTVRTNLGALRIRGGRPGTEIFVDDRPRGRLPLRTLRVTAGDHNVQVRDPEEPLSRIVSVGGEETVEVVLPGAEPTAPPGPGSSSSAASRPEEGGPWAPGWGIAAVGGAAILAGIVTGALALRVQEEMVAFCNGDRRSCPEDYATNERFLDLQAQGHLLAPLTDGLLIGGAAVAALGVALAFALEAESSHATEPIVALDVASSGARARLRFRW